MGSGTGACAYAGANGTWAGRAANAGTFGSSRGIVSGDMGGGGVRARGRGCETTVHGSAALQIAEPAGSEGAAGSGGAAGVTAGAKTDENRAVQEAMGSGFGRARV